MASCVMIIVLLLIYQVSAQIITTQSRNVPEITTEMTNARINCTSSKIMDFLEIGKTFVPDILSCTDKMADLGHDYLVAMNDFYNYNYDDFNRDFQSLAQCDKLLCTKKDVSYLLSKLLRLRAQMVDMLEMVKYKSTTRKSTMRCVYKVLNQFTKAASKAIACPA